MVKKNIKKIVIHTKDLGKTYKLYTCRKDRIKDFIFGERSKNYTAYEALKNISFELEEGEVVGVIGQNGSGKSTLLKILTGVVSPSTGAYFCHGKVSALLELGAGFNPELTGIENLHHLGAIQGLSKIEINEKIEAILQFADIGQYAFQPVKSYSSGMYVRLAFAFSIHVDPEILITDEALSVGDVRFQRKCMRKIEEFKNRGKTILLCTHNMSLVKDFCSKVIWLHNGEMKEMGSPQTVVEKYLAYMLENNMLHNEEPLQNSNSIFSAFYNSIPEKLLAYPWCETSKLDQFGTKKALIIASCLVIPETCKPLLQIHRGEEISICLLIKTLGESMSSDYVIHLHNPSGTEVIKVYSKQFIPLYHMEADRLYFVNLTFAIPALQNDQYSISVSLRSNQNDGFSVEHFIHDVQFLYVSNPEPCFNTGAIVAIRNLKLQTKEIS